MTLNCSNYWQRQPSEFSTAGEDRGWAICERDRIEVRQSARKTRQRLYYMKGRQKRSSTIWGDKIEFEPYVRRTETKEY